MTPAKRVEDFLATCSRADLERAFKEPWFNELFPRICDLVGCDQGTKVHLEGDAAVHTAMVFENVATTAHARLGRAPDFIERLSAVLHDLRKPATRDPQPDGGVFFPGHEALVAEEIPAIAESLGLSKADSERLRFVVGRHGDAHGFPHLPNEERAAIASSPWILSLAILQEADAKSCLLTGGSHLPVYWDELLAGSSQL